MRFLLEPTECSVCLFVLQGGLILLLLALLCHVANRSFSRKLAVEIGGEHCPVQHLRALQRGRTLPEAVIAACLYFD